MAVYIRAQVVPDSQSTGVGHQSEAKKMRVPRLEAIDAMHVLRRHRLDRLVLLGIEPVRRGCLQFDP
jgi:hypothetical protein